MTLNASRRLSFSIKPLEPKGSLEFSGDDLSPRLSSEQRLAQCQALAKNLAGVRGQARIVPNDQKIEEVKGMCVCVCV